MTEQQPPTPADAATQRIRRPDPAAGRTEVMSLDDLMDVASGAPARAPRPAAPGPAPAPAAPPPPAPAAGGRPASGGPPPGPGGRVAPFPLSLASPPPRPQAPRGSARPPVAPTWQRLRADSGRAGRELARAARAWWGVGDRMVATLAVAAVVVLLVVVGLV